MESITLPLLHYTFINFLKADQIRRQILSEFSDASFL